MGPGDQCQRREEFRLTGNRMHLIQHVASHYHNVALSYQILS
jgi:hypothetical protein